MKVYHRNMFMFFMLILFCKVSCNEKRAMSVFEQLLKSKHEMRKRVESRAEYAKAMESFLRRIENRRSGVINFLKRNQDYVYNDQDYSYSEPSNYQNYQPTAYEAEYDSGFEQHRGIQNRQKQQTQKQPQQQQPQQQQPQQQQQQQQQEEQQQPERDYEQDGATKEGNTKPAVDSAENFSEQENSLNIVGNSGTSYVFRYEVPLDSKGDFRLYWDVDMTTEIIYFRIEARIHKTDFLAFGFSDYGEAQNADFTVLWTDWKGKHMFQDMHTDKDGALSLDDSQDYVLDDVIIQDGNMNLLFHRKFDTCDNEDYMIDGGTSHVIFFTKSGVQQTVDAYDVTDVALGLQRVQLIKSQLPDPPLPDDTFEFVMHVNNVEIPDVETTYWFATQQLPELPDKHHIIRFEGVISPESVGIVHHMEVFHCDVPAGQRLPDFNAASGSNEGRPKGLEACRQVIGAWAMGAQPLSHPEEAGVPIGGPGVSRYVMVEVHYNNPDRRKGVIDSSGIKFYVTRQLRQYDAGIMEIGLEYTDKMALPPRLPEWDLTGYCIPECTKVGLPEGGIKVFASQLHTHLTGRKTFTKHFRDGIQLPDLNRDNHYSPHYQEIRKLPRPVTVLPGDALVHVCQDRTVDRENVTLGGFAITDEMCVNYMHYYPKAHLEVCKSSVTTSSLYGFFNFMKKYNGQNSSSDLPISDNYKTIDWSPMNIHLLKRYYGTAPLSMQCNQSDGTRFPGDWEEKPVPKLLYPAPPTERPCLL